MNVQKTKGFTIIEVVLVLAIAGLIFLVVFLALPALQRSQRDTQRRSDVGRVIAAVQSYQSNKSGALPTAAELGGGTFTTAYLKAGGSAFDDPTGVAYTFPGSPAAGSGAAAITAAEAQATNGTGTSGQLGYAIGTTCNGTTKGRSISVVAKLENGGYYCANN